MQVDGKHLVVNERGLKKLRQVEVGTIGGGTFQLVPLVILPVPE